MEGSSHVQGMWEGIAERSTPHMQEVRGQVGNRGCIYQDGNRQGNNAANKES